MNRYLDISIRTATLLVVGSVFVSWWVFAIGNPYQPSAGCEPGDYGCRIDALDAHQVP